MQPAEECWCPGAGRGQRDRPGATEGARPCPLLDARLLAADRREFAPVALNHQFVVFSTAARAPLPSRLEMQINTSQSNRRSPTETGCSCRRLGVQGLQVLSPLHWTVGCTGSGGPCRRESRGPAWLWLDGPPFTSPAPVTGAARGARSPHGPGKRFEAGTPQQRQIRVFTREGPAHGACLWAAVPGDPLEDTVEAS